MSASTVRNLNSIEPDLVDVLQELRRTMFLDLNCHAIGQVKAFYPATQTADVSFTYLRRFVEVQTDGTYKNIDKQYPLLVSVPVVNLYGGKAGLTLPIATGDYCLIFFTDRDFDIWFEYGQVVAPTSQKTHALGDAIALVGLRNKINKISSYDTTHAKLYNNNTQVAVSDGKVKVDNGSQNLKTELTSLCSKLNSLCTAIQALTVTCAGPGNPSSIPINSASFSTLSSQISTISSNLSSLLE